MKKILLFVGAAALLFGCEAAAIKEVKATAYSNAGNSVTIGDVFDKGLQNASWTSETDEAGVETVTVTGLFDWQNGGGLVETAFTFAKNADGVWEPVAVSAGGDTADNAFSVGLAFLMVYAVYGEAVASEADGNQADKTTAEETETSLEPML